MMETKSCLEKSKEETQETPGILDLISFYVFILLANSVSMADLDDVAAGYFVEWAIWLVIWIIQLFFSARIYCIEKEKSKSEIRFHTRKIRVDALFTNLIANFSKDAFIILQFPYFQIQTGTVKDVLAPIWIFFNNISTAILVTFAIFLRIKIY